MMKLAFAITLVIAAVACAHESHFSEDAFSSQDIVPENDGAAAPTSEFATAETESTPAAPAQEAVQAKATWGRRRRAKATWGRRRRRYLRRRRTTKKKATKKKATSKRAAKKKARKGDVCAVTSAVKRLGSYLKRLATKLCRKVNRRVVKKTHEYVRKNVKKFCIKTCIKSSGNVYLVGGGSPAAKSVAVALDAGCKCGCKNSMKAMVRKIRHQYMSGATMDHFMADNICAFVGLASGPALTRRRRFA